MVEGEEGNEKQASWNRCESLLLMSVSVSRFHILHVRNSSRNVAVALSSIPSASIEA